MGENSGKITELDQQFYCRKCVDHDSLQNAPRREAEQEIVSNLRLLDDQELYDSLVFDRKLLTNIDRVIELFETISDNNVFANPHFSQWNWFNQNSFQTIATWIVSQVERMLQFRFLEDRQRNNQKRSNLAKISTNSSIQTSEVQTASQSFDSQILVETGTSSVDIHSEQENISHFQRLLCFWRGLNASKKRKMLNKSSEMLKLLFLRSQVEPRNGAAVDSCTEWYKKKRDTFYSKQKMPNDEEVQQNFTQFTDDSRAEEFLELLCFTTLTDTTNILTLVNKKLHERLDEMNSEVRAQDLILNDQLARKDSSKKKTNPGSNNNNSNSSNIHKKNKNKQQQSQQLSQQQSSQPVPQVQSEQKKQKKKGKKCENLEVKASLKDVSQSSQLSQQESLITETLPESQSSSSQQPVASQILTSPSNSSSFSSELREKSQQKSLSIQATHSCSSEEQKSITVELLKVCVNSKKEREEEEGSEKSSTCSTTCSKKSHSPPPQRNISKKPEIKLEEKSQQTGPKKSQTKITTSAAKQKQVEDKLHNLSPPTFPIVIAGQPKHQLRTLPSQKGDEINAELATATTVIHSDDSEGEFIQVLGPRKKQLQSKQQSQNKRENNRQITNKKDIIITRSSVNNGQSKVPTTVTVMEEKPKESRMGKEPLREDTNKKCPLVWQQNLRLNNHQMSWDQLQGEEIKEKVIAIATSSANYKSTPSTTPSKSSSNTQRTSNMSKMSEGKDEHKCVKDDQKKGGLVQIAEEEVKKSSATTITSVVDSPLKRLSKQVGGGQTTAVYGCQNAVVQGGQTAAVNAPQKMRARVAKRLARKKITEDIRRFTSSVNAESFSCQPSRVQVFLRIQHIIKSINKGQNTVDIRTFGSCATGLALPTSDIDLGITGLEGNPKNELIAVLTSLANALEKFDWVKHIERIFTAHIPIIKIEVDPLIGFTDGLTKDEVIGLFGQCPLETLDMLQQGGGQMDVNARRVKVDITVECQIKTGSSTEILNHLGFLSTDFVMRWMNYYANLQPITVLLKCFLNARNLNTNFKGGISSYCLLIMIIAFFRENQQLALSDDFYGILTSFLRFYGKDFNPETVGISLANAIPFFQTTQCSLQSKLQVVDPLTSRVMTQNTYLIDEIMQEFDEFYNYITEFTRKVEISLERHSQEQLECIDRLENFDSLHSQALLQPELANLLLPNHNQIQRFVCEVDLTKQLHYEAVFRQQQQDHNHNIDVFVPNEED